MQIRMEIHWVIGKIHLLMHRGQYHIKEWSMQFNIRLRVNWFILRIDAVGHLVKWMC